MPRVCISLRSLRVFIVSLALMAGAAPAFALDPITLILLRVVRDKVISTGIETAVEKSMAATPRAPAAPNPQIAIDDHQLRRLIDEGFLHLSSQQRAEVYASARRILLDPQHAHEAAALYAQLAVTASATRQAYESINKLSPERKRSIAAEAREAYVNMPPDSREELTALLRTRVVPLPADLVAMMQAEFERVRETPPQP